MTTLAVWPMPDPDHPVQRPYGIAASPGLIPTLCQTELTKLPIITDDGPDLGETHSMYRCRPPYLSFRPPTPRRASHATHAPPPPLPPALPPSCSARRSERRATAVFPLLGFASVASLAARERERGKLP
jgi:hypothetical protein